MTPLGRRGAVMMAMVVAIVALAWAAGSGPGSVGPEAVTGSVLPVGTVQPLADPGVALASPADGRIDGPDFQMTVLGTAEVGSAGAGSGAIRPPAGDRLEVFRLEGSPYPAPSGAVPSSTTSVTASVGVPGSAWSLPGDALSGGGSATFAVDVPAHASPVVLTVVDGAVTQTFSLTAGRLVGPVPAVLYRDPSSPTITDAVDQTITDTSASYGSSASSVSITVSDVSLDYVSPTGQAAPGPDQAWVVPNLSASTVQGGPVYLFEPAPGSWLHLVLPNGTSVPGQSQPVFQGSDLLGATYWFPAPADLTSARLVFGPGNVLALPGLFDLNPVAVSMPTPVSVDLAFPTFPAPKAAAATRAPSTSPARKVSANNVRSGRSWAWVLVAVLALGLALLVFDTLRRRRTEPWRRGPVIDVRARALPPRRAAALPLAEALALALPAATPRQTDARRSFADSPAGPRAPIPLGPAGAGADEAHKERSTRIRFLGPLLIETADGSRLSKPARELLVYLSLHRDLRLTPTALGNRLRPSGRRVPNVRTLSTYVSAVRRMLPEGAIPDSTDWGGYQLVGPGADCDWDEFCALASRASRLNGDDAAELLSRALGLVRGKPFADVARKSMPWIDEENWPDKITAVVEAVSHELVTLHLSAGRYREAAAAAAAGLTGVEATVELYGDAILAGGGISRAALEDAIRVATEALGEDVSLVQAQIDQARAALSLHR